MNTNNENFETKEKILNPKSGIAVLMLNIVGLIVSLPILIFGIVLADEGINVGLGVGMIIASILGSIAIWINFAGLKALSPNEALVLTLFGKYYGTIVESGFFYVNPFCSAYNPTKTPLVVSDGNKATSVENNNQDKTSGKKISMKAIALSNRTQKVNDLEGNPIEVAAMVIWKVKSPYAAVFSVDNYQEYISLQSDSALRNVVCKYAYDNEERSDETQLTLRGNSDEIAKMLQEELQMKVEEAGLEVIEVKITHLAYAQEIAAAMLQRQQAAAILSARRLIVEGAVSMVQQALEKLDSENIVELDDERKATMISNLLVVLCANKEAQPIVNSGSIY